MIRFARLPFALALLPVAVGIAAAQTVTPSATAAGTSTLSPVDYNFVAQVNLGAPFQIDSGRIAEQKGTTAAIRDYAHLMAVSHVPVVDALNTVLQRKGLTAPPDTLRGWPDLMRERCEPGVCDLHVVLRGIEARADPADDLAVDDDR